MKKLLLLLMVASVGIAGTATAQKKSKHWGNDKNKYSKKYDRNDDRYDHRNDKYTSNAPRKVRDAFNRDFPNVSDVSWTKDRGIWTASFRKTGLFGGANSISYKANGQRVGNSNNSIFGNRRNDRSAGVNTQKRTGLFEKRQGF